MLYLGPSDILAAADFNAVMDAIEQAYQIDRNGNYEMPVRMHVENGENTLLYMPCFLNTIFGTKILSLFPGNAAKQRPVIEGIVLLNDVETGTPVAILDGARLTAIRTGAVGGTAVRHITPVNAVSLGLIGAGVQGFYQALFACTARKINTVAVYDQVDDKLENFCTRLREALPHVKIEKAGTVKELLKKSEIVITATPATEPVLPNDQELLRGKSFIGIGSYKPEMREYPQSLYSLVNNVLIDTEHGLEESGDLITPLKNKWIEEKQIIKFGSYLKDKSENTARDETMFFKSVGMALFDIVVSELIYSRALENNIGTLLA
jgi:ornithine cyclodeaminase/alanine dehydrogenase-like protein (mu-crystallin family)